MSYVVRNGLLVPKREVIRRGAAHARVPHANLILRRIADPILRPATLAVGFDAAGTASSHGTVTGATGLTDSNLTIGSSGNCLIYTVSAIVGAGSLNGVAAHWDSAGTNQAMSNLISGVQTNSSGVQTVIFGLVAPTIGNKTFKLSGSWGTAFAIVVFGCSFTNVNQTGGATTFNHTASGTNISSNTTPHVTCTTTTNDAVVAVMAAANAGGTNTITMGQTTLYTGTGTSFPASGANYELNGSTAAMTGTLSLTDSWVAVATNMAGIIGGGAVAPRAGLQGLASSEW